jgi:Ca2+-binding RTX toxin-like protein
MLIGRAGSDIFIGGLDGDRFSGGGVFDQLLIKALANELTQSPMSTRTKIG